MFAIKELRNRLILVLRQCFVNCQFWGNRKVSLLIVGSVEDLILSGFILSQFLQNKKFPNVMLIPL